MKPRFLSKLNPRLIIAFTVLLLAFIIHSCKKDNSGNKNKQQPNVLNASMVNLAKQWYNTTYAPANGAGKLATQSIGGGPNAWNQTFIPYWDKANTYTLDSLGYIELPALKRGDMAMSYKSVNASSFNFGKPQSLTSLIIVNKNGNFYMYAMTILADSSYLNGDYTKLAKNTYRNKDNNFSGNVYYHRMDGSFVNGWRFQNGVVTGIITLAPPGTPAGPATQNKNNPVVDVAQVVDCQTTTTTTYWEQCSYYTNDYEDAHPFNCFDYTTEDSYTTCTTQSSGPGGGSSAPPPCTPPSGGSSDPPSVDVSQYKMLVADPNPPNGGNPPGGIVDQNNQIGTNECRQQTSVTDSIKNPCIKNAVENAIDGGLNNYTSNIVTAVFGNSASFDLNFTDSSLPSGVSGETNCQGNPNTNGFFIADVDLNDNILSTASNEYIAVSAMHEILHAYMTLNGTLGTLNQHNTMATSYMTKMETDLQALFPGMSSADATALAWGGLEDTTAWKNLVATDPVSANSIININNQYKNGNGTKGHRCS